jgi:hypothetical protein
MLASKANCMDRLCPWIGRVAPLDRRHLPMTFTMGTGNRIVPVIGFQAKPTFPK